MATETKDRIRLNLSPEELIALFEVVEELDVLIGPISTVYDKLKLYHFKITEGMAVSSYKVRATPKPRKHSMDGLGFTNSPGVPAGKKYDPAEFMPEIKTPDFSNPPNDDMNSPEYQEWLIARYSAASTLQGTQEK